MICCRLTSLQQSLYKLLVASKAGECQLNEDSGKGTGGSLSFITQLKKLCNRKLKKLCNSKLKKLCNSKLKKLCNYKLMCILVDHDLSASIHQIM